MFLTDRTCLKSIPSFKILTLKQLTFIKIKAKNLHVRQLLLYIIMSLHINNELDQPLLQNTSFSLC